jgi:hypothetical protein
MTIFAKVEGSLTLAASSWPPGKVDRPEPARVSAQASDNHLETNG